MLDDLGLSPTTELEAINAILFGIGESPVSSLEDLSFTDASQALTLLRRESRALQSKGWSFNMDERVRLQPEPNGEVPLPPNGLGITFKGQDAGPRFAARSGRVYDKLNHTFAIGRPVVADVTLMLPFEDLPEAARLFIMVRAGRKFQDATLGDQSLHQFEEKDEVAAWAEFLSREAENADFNIVRDSSSVRAVVIDRYRGL